MKNLYNHLISEIKNEKTEKIIIETSLFMRNNQKNSEFDRKIINIYPDSYSKTNLSSHNDEIYEIEVINFNLYLEEDYKIVKKPDEINEKNENFQFSIEKFDVFLLKFEEKVMKNKEKLTISFEIPFELVIFFNFLNIKEGISTENDYFSMKISLILNEIYDGLFEYYYQPDVLLFYIRIFIFILLLKDKDFLLKIEIKITNLNKDLIDKYYTKHHTDSNLYDNYMNLNLKDDFDLYIIEELMIEIQNSPIQLIIEDEYTSNNSQLLGNIYNLLTNKIIFCYMNIRLANKHKDLPLNNCKIILKNLNLNTFSYFISNHSLFLFSHTIEVEFLIKISRNHEDFLKNELNFLLNSSVFPNLNALYVKVKLDTTINKSINETFPSNHHLKIENISKSLSFLHKTSNLKSIFISFPWKSAYFLLPKDFFSNLPYIENVYISNLSSLSLNDNNRLSSIRKCKYIESFEVSILETEYISVESLEILILLLTSSELLSIRLIKIYISSCNSLFDAEYCDYYLRRVYNIRKIEYFGIISELNKEKNHENERFFYIKDFFIKNLLEKQGNHKENHGDSYYKDEEMINNRIKDIAYRFSICFSKLSLDFKDELEEILKKIIKNLENTQNSNEKLVISRQKNEIRAVSLNPTDNSYIVISNVYSIVFCLYKYSKIVKNINKKTILKGVFEFYSRKERRNLYFLRKNSIFHGDHKLISSYDQY